MKIKLTLGLVLLVHLALAQNPTNFWSDVSDDNVLLPRAGERDIKATNYRTVSLALEQLKASLQSAPLELTGAARRRALQLDFPMPDGSMKTFAVVESPVMEPGLAARYPSIKTFKGTGIEDRSETIRFGYTDRGLHAAIQTRDGQIFIDPLATSQTKYYQIYHTRHAITADAAGELTCGVPPAGTERHATDESVVEDRPLLRRENNDALNLHTYRLAVTTSGEFAQRFGATTKAEVMTRVVDILNRANAVFETDVAIRLVLVDNTDAVFFLDSEDDPFTDGASVEDSYTQIPAVLDANIGQENYDVGHGLVALCGSGVIGIGGGDACKDTGRDNRTYKGFGISCMLNISASSIEVFAHELGHQFSAAHTWSNCPGNEGQLSSGSAYEPGGGSTIMSYTNACREQTIQNVADAYFHTESVQQILNYSRTGAGATCASIVSTENDEPIVNLNYENGFYIPIETPFELTANATDANDDPLTFCWEQYDLGPTSPIGNPMGDAPAFRSFPPTNSPTRIFPRMQNIVENTSSPVEVLPTYDRTLTFRATVRDNHPGAGAAVWEQVRFRSTSSAGPFLVTHPNEDTVRWTAGTYVPVRWDVANTDNNLVNCKIVTIKLSLDGGFTYPVTLVESVPNTGEAMVPVPDVITDRARVRVEAADNIFFDISNQSFEIQAATQATFTLDVAPRTINSHCLPASLDFQIRSEAFQGFDSPIELELVGTEALPEDATAVLSRSVVMPSETATLSIDFATQVQETYDLEVRGVTEAGQSITIPVTFSTVSNDFSDFQIQNPVEGEAGIVLSTAFTWNDLPNADFYDFELSDSPVFGAALIESATEIEDTTYQPEVFFGENQLYFWRIRPGNEACGYADDFIGPFTFHTATVACEETASDNVPINISGTGLPTINSTLTIPTSGTISDVNIPFIKGSYQPVNSLRVKLISPEGTEVTLFDQNCGTTLRFETGFDDESPTEITCPPDDRVVVRPVDSLAAFIGENTAGTWTLQMQVVEPGFGGGGALESWNIEFCSTFEPNNPFIVINDTLRLPPNARNNITINELEVQDTDNAPAELVYTLVSLPAHGDLTLSGVALEVGNTFSQLDINELRVLYEHNGDDNLTDSFTFVVQDGTGGFLPVQQGNILIDANATTSTDELLNAASVRIFPNPAHDLLNVQLAALPKGMLTISLYNVQGQELLRERFETAADILQVNTSALPSGMYFVTLRSEAGAITKKVSIQR